MPSSFTVKHSSGLTLVDFKSPLASVATNTHPLILIADRALTAHDFLSRQGTIWIDAEEHKKNLDGVQRLCQKLSDLGCTRSTKVIAVGGGVLQDIVTMSAGIFMRGIEWSFVPTTTNSILDSCLGGKSAINLGSHKNALGNFHPPTSVFIEVDLLKTLDAENYLGGIFEGLKISFASGPRVFHAFCQELEAQNYKVSPALVEISLLAKKSFIEEDEFDVGVRLLLNFGHTFGHALEAASNFQIPHGVAVALGMLAACRWSEFESLQAKRLAEVTHLLLATWNQKGSVTIDWDVFKLAFSRDKKHTAQNLRLVLPGSEGLFLASIPKSQGVLQELSELMRLETERYVNHRR